MQLSIVIVNYNVKHFLQQCLQSVFDALKGIDAEVFVVDNKSVDGSVEMVQQHFPQVKLIANTQNLGFSKANNLALRQAKGAYHLLLNPDTVVQEDTFRTVLKIVAQDPEIGGLGIKMIDGTGNYLPESKRGLPSPSAALYKMTGLCALFPKSKRFAKYYLGHLSKNKNAEIEVLSGAFMLLKKEALDKVGLLDEDFFMYGEDIDLSYRVLKGGYKNYYCAESSIIHYKGESTKKGSLNYVRVFYLAMILYAQKHFTGNHKNIFVTLIKLAVYAKAFLAVLSSGLRQLWKPLLEFLAMTVLFTATMRLYSAYSAQAFPPEIVTWAPSIQALLVLICFVFVGAYKVAGGYTKLQKAILVSIVSSGFLYSLIPEGMRFSRALVIGNPIVLAPYILAIRKITDRLKLSRYFVNHRQNIMLLGVSDEQNNFAQRLKQSNEGIKISTWDPQSVIEASGLEQAEIELLERCRVNGIAEIIFVNEHLRNEHIIAFMSLDYRQELSFKIIPKSADFVIGSGSKDSNGDLVYLEPEPLFSLRARRKKRWGDLFICLLLLPLFPYLLVRNRPLKFFQVYFSVLSGKKSWVGLNKEFRETLLNPNTIDGVISIARADLSTSGIVEINRSYCKNYQFQQDFNLIFTHLGNLDQH